jgi:hypothetical protein
MGVKSTKNLFRQEAEEKYVSLKLKMELEKQKRIWRAEAVAMDDTDLENVLERMNDQANYGEGFENYCILKGGFSDE